MNENRMQHCEDSDYQYKNYPRCPYCGRKLNYYATFSEVKDGEVSEGNEVTYDCPECQKEFKVTVDITYDFTTVFPDDLNEII